MAVTLKDVAEMAGVSRSAVSRAFTEGASVSDKVRLKVMEASATLGLQSRMLLASSLTTGRTKLIGVVSDNFHNPIFLEVFDLVITKGLQERGLRPLLVNSVRRGGSRKFSAHAAAIFSGWGDRSLFNSASELRRGLPNARACQLCMLFGRHSAQPKVTYSRHRQLLPQGKWLAQTLIARGYDTIGFMGGPETATSTQDRYAGFFGRSCVSAYAHVAHSVSYAKAYSFAAGTCGDAAVDRGGTRASLFLRG